MESTGFKCVNGELFVGDMVAWHSGYQGFFNVVKRPDGYWLVDRSEFEDERYQDIKIDKDLHAHFTKVDKDNTYDDIMDQNTDFIDNIADAN